MVVLLAVPSHATTVTTRVSVSSDGTQAGSRSFSHLPTLSRSGRLVVFSSSATNLVANDTNHRHDVFLHDTSTGETTRVSVKSNGDQAAGGGSFEPALSPGGRFVAFTSQATNLVDNDMNGQADVFVHDRTTGETTRVSVASDGSEGISAWSLAPDISKGGRFIAFESGAPNLVPDDTNDRADVFVHDRITGETTRVSIASDGSQSGAGSFGSHKPALSSDGRLVAFSSHADDLVPGDGNGSADVFVHDSITGDTSRVSVNSDGVETHGPGGCCPAVAISSDGRVVAFDSRATDLVANDLNQASDVFVHNLATGQTERVSATIGGIDADGGSFGPTLSQRGRYVGFYSVASNLIPQDTNNAPDVFLYNRQTGALVRMSVSSNGSQGNKSSLVPDISGHGEAVTFESEASNLVPGDTNGRPRCRGDEARIPCTDVFLVKTARR